MNNQDFIKHCKNAVWLTIDIDDNKADEFYESLQVVWFSKTLQNHKALVMSTDGYFNETYWEVTCNGDKDEYYVDEYIKTSNEVISGDDIETM